MTNKRQAKQSIDWNALISHHPIFDVIDAEERKFLLSDKVSRKHVLKAGEVILKQGETGNSLFVVCEGAVSVRLEGPDGKSIELYTLTDGEVFGEMALFGQRLRAATLVTTEPCKLLEIGGDEFLVLMQKHHEISLYLLAKLGQRLRHTDDMILTRRITGIGSSLGELKTQLNVVTQTTDAKLAAAQTMFDQTSKRAGEVIDSAGRARTRMTWMASTATVLLGLLASAGFWNFKDAQREIMEAQQDVKERAEKVAKSAADAELAAGKAEQAADQAGSSASTAEESAERTKVAEATLEKAISKAKANASGIDTLRAEIDQTKVKISQAYYEGVLTLFKAKVTENSFSDDTVAYYIDCIKADLPDLRRKLVDFLHQEIALGKRNGGFLDMFRRSLEQEMILSADDNVAQVATYYFLALIHILENNLNQSATYEKHVERTSRGNRDFFAYIFGSDEFETGEFITIVTSQENSPDLRQRKQEGLKRLYAKLQQSN